MNSINSIYRRFDQLTPPQKILIGYLTLSLVGAWLLTLPISSKSGVSTNFLDALFTAVSAICVTGQTTLNTSEHWSYFGSTVILTLIEIGGLGFMTLWLLLFWLTGKKLNLRQQKVMQESLNLEDTSKIVPLTLYIVSFAIFIQFCGSLILSLDFIPRFGWAKGIYFSVFHSISAFCNAGFDLFGNSLMDFQNNPLVLLTISSLIFIGGLGFIVWQDLLSFYKNRKLLIHTKIVLVTTSFLLILSLLLYFLAESSRGTFEQLTWWERIANYLFLAVTPRTAGYANVDYIHLSQASIFLTLILMFIGATSASTGGGIKVTTLATVLLYMLRTFQGKKVVIYHRTIPQSLIAKSIFIIGAAIILIIVATFTLSITETIPEGSGIEYILMEVISCIGTVGLSLGLTPNLTSIGKLVLIILMYIGRIGLITFFWSFGGHDSRSKVDYPEERILIG